MPIKDYTAATAAKFLFDNVVNRSRCLNILISDQGTHFVNQLIDELTEEFQFLHQNRTPYHPQASSDVEELYDILENALTKICIVQRNDWDQKIHAVLWDYCTTYKKLARQTPF